VAKQSRNDKQAVRERNQGLRAWIPGIGVGRFTLLIILATLGIEAALAFRIWVQLTGLPPSVESLRFAYDAAGLLASPFHSLDRAGTQHDDVLQFSTIVAVEAYAMLAVALFGFALVVRMLVKTISVQFDREGVTVGKRASARQPA
jgi:hypothetical protein